MEEAYLVELYRASEYKVSELEELVGVTRSTVHRRALRHGRHGGSRPLP